MTLTITTVWLIFRCGKCGRILGNYRGEPFVIVPGSKNTVFLCSECAKEAKL